MKPQFEFIVGKYRCRNGVIATITARTHGSLLHGSIEDLKSQWHTWNVDEKYMDLNGIAKYGYAYRNEAKTPDYDLVERL